MGNASDEVKATATFTTSSNAEDGFARAMENIHPAARGQGRGSATMNVVERNRSISDRRARCWWFLTPRALFEAAAELFVDRGESMPSRSVDVSPSRCPADRRRKSLYQLLATEPWRNRIDWSKAHFFWGDERWVPSTDKQSNYRMANEALLSKVPCPRRTSIASKPMAVSRSRSRQKNTRKRSENSLAAIREFDLDSARHRDERAYRFAIPAPPYPARARAAGGRGLHRRSEDEPDHLHVCRSSTTSRSNVFLV